MLKTKGRVEGREKGEGMGQPPAAWEERGRRHHSTAGGGGWEWGWVQKRVGCEPCCRFRCAA
eukprot:scaffold11558_cov101-Isochrysis_galbana.AAC.1